MNLIKKLSIAASVAAITIGTAVTASAQSTSLRIQTHFSPETLSGKLAAKYIEDITAM